MARRYPSTRPALRRWWRCIWPVVHFVTAIANWRVVGGVNLILSPEAVIAMCQSRMMAPDGRCKTFDAAADGFGQAEGCGVLVVKRLSDAQRDGDTILALVRGTAINQDGASSGLTAPNGPSQEAVIRRRAGRRRTAPSRHCLRRNPWHWHHAGRPDRSAGLGGRVLRGANGRAAAVARRRQIQLGPLRSRGRYGRLHEGGARATASRDSSQFAFPHSESADSLAELAGARRRSANAFRTATRAAYRGSQRVRLQRAPMRMSSSRKRRPRPQLRQQVTKTARCTCSRWRLAAAVLCASSASATTNTSGSIQTPCLPMVALLSQHGSLAGRTSPRDLGPHDGRSASRGKGVPGRRTREQSPDRGARWPGSPAHCFPVHGARGAIHRHGPAAVRVRACVPHGVRAVRRRCSLSICRVHSSSCYTVATTRSAPGNN